MERRHNSEQHATQQRETERDEEHLPVQLGMEREPFLTVRQQSGQHTHTSHRDGDTGRAAQHGEQRALGQQLAYHPQSTRAQAESYRHLARARRRAGQQEVGRVRARDGEEQANHRQQHIQRLRILAAKAVESARPFFETEDREIGALLVVDGRRGHPLRKRRRQRCLGLFETDARTQTSHHLEPVEVSSEKRVHGSWIEQHPGAHRQIHVGVGTRIDAKEF